jgi:RNA polymerase sigma-70 factor (ECF subfamily)
MREQRDQTDTFVELLTRHQSRLYAFVSTVVADRELAEEVLQETNLVLWRQAEQFDHSRDFMPWALAVARNQIRAAFQSRKRSRLVFDLDVAEAIADRLMTRCETIGNRQAALADCLKALPGNQRSLICQRYQNELTVDELARQQEVTANAMAVVLHRIRQQLSRCVQARLGGTAS